MVGNSVEARPQNDGTQLLFRLWTNVLGGMYICSRSLVPQSSQAHAW